MPAIRDECQCQPCIAEPRGDLAGDPELDKNRERDRSESFDKREGEVRRLGVPLT